MLLDGAKDAAYESMAREADGILQHEEEAMAEAGEELGDGDEAEDRHHRQLEIMAAQVGAALRGQGGGGPARPV